VNLNMKEYIFGLVAILIILFSCSAVSARTLGDVNNDNAVDLADSIMALQVQVGVSTSQPVSLQADVNSDGRIGFEEAIYALQVTTGLKTPTGFTAAMLDASPTYYVTYTGDTDGTTTAGNTQQTFVFSGTGPYVLTITEEYFDASDVSQSTYTFTFSATLNPDGTITATLSGDPFTITLTLDSETATYLYVLDDEGSDKYWYFAQPAEWLTSGGTPPAGFTAEMLDASPTYYVTFSGDPDRKTDQGTTQEILVFSGTEPYFVTVTGEYFDASDVSQDTYTGGSVNIVLNPDGTLTATVSGAPGATTITLDEETATYLLVHGGEGSDSWIDYWYFAQPAEWLTSG